MKRLVLMAIGAYRATSFLRRPTCRFYPSCSRYAYGSVERFGVVRGLILSVVRLLRCQPLDAGGVDEVPERFWPYSNAGRP